MAPPIPAAAVVASIPGMTPSGSTSGGCMTITTAGHHSSSNKGSHVNEDTLKLIECVKARPALWHRKHLRQRVQVAHRGWEEIRQAFKATEVASLKVRWKTLRDSFRREVKRMEDGEISASGWPLFERMSFLIGHFRTRESYYKSGSQSPEQAKSVDESWGYTAGKCEQRTEAEGTSLASMGESDGETFSTCANSKQIVYESSVTAGVHSTHGGDSDPEDLTMTETYEVLHAEENDDMVEMGTNHNDEVIEVPAQLYGEVTFKNKLRARIKTEPAEIERQAAAKRKASEMDSDYNFLMSLHPFMSNLPGKKNLSVRIKIQQLIAEAMEEEG